MNEYHTYVYKYTVFKCNSTLLFYSLGFTCLGLMNTPPPSDVATWSNDLHPTYFPKYCALIRIPMTLPWESSRRVTGLATPPPPLPFDFLKILKRALNKSKEKGEQNITIISKIKFSQSVYTASLFFSLTTFWDKSLTHRLLFTIPFLNTDFTSSYSDTSLK